MRNAKRLALDVDLPALARKTKNFTGSELAELIKNASGMALLTWKKKPHNTDSEKPLHALVKSIIRSISSKEWLKPILSLTERISTALLNKWYAPCFSKEGSLCTSSPCYC